MDSTRTPLAVSERPDGAKMALDDWQVRLSRSLLPFDMKSPSGQINGFVHGVELGSVAFTSQWSDAHTAARGADRVAGAEACHLLTFQIAGSKSITQDGRTARLERGSFAIYNTSRPVTIESRDDAASLSLRIPQRCVDVDPDVVQELSVTALGTETGLAPVLAGMLVKLDQYADGVLESSRARTGDHVAGLVDAMLREKLEEHGLRLDGGGTAELLHRVCRYIDRNLGDPGLTPNTVAAAHFMSLRGLYKLFEREDLTVARLIRARRIEMASRDLLDPHQSRTSVATIATRWGFQDVSYFGQVFRESTGVTPARYRTSQGLIDD